MITWPELAEALRRCAGGPAVAVHLAGRPGGLIRLRAGTVVDTWTSGSPLSAPAADRPMGAADPLARLAMTDAVFVMAAGRVNTWQAEEDPAAATDAVGMDLQALLAEVDRRMRRVLRPGGPPLPPEETVVRRVQRPAPARLTHTLQERALLEAVGPGPEAAHTVRDLAFALGRGVFAVLLDVQRLAAMGAIALTTYPTAERRPAQLVQARRAPTGPAPAVPRPRPVQPAVPRPAPAGLAQRVPGATVAGKVEHRAAWQPPRHLGRPPDSRSDAQP